MSVIQYVAAVYREHAGQDWQDCELLRQAHGGYVVREVGRTFCGVRLTDASHIRVPLEIEPEHQGQ